MRPRRRPTTSTSKLELLDGHRSGLEKRVADDLRARGVAFQYEPFRIAYEKPARVHKYLPDFVLPNGIIVEAKGLFEADDREKHLLLKAQHPELDVRFLFQSERTKIYPKSKTTLIAWAEHHGFLWCVKTVPAAWLKEPARPIPDHILIRRPSKK